MADTTFVNNVTLSDADWFNDLNRLHYTILGDPANAAAVRTGAGAAAAGANSDITSLSAPALGAATATTQARTDISTKVATTAYVGGTGKVLQVVYSTDGGATTTSTSLTNITTSVQPITPLSATSNLIIECVFNPYIQNLAATNVSAVFRLYDSTNAVLIGSELVHGCAETDGDVGLQSLGIIKTKVVSTGVTARNFLLYGKTGNASATASGITQVWTITEVAG